MNRRINEEEKRKGLFKNRKEINIFVTLATAAATIAFIVFTLSMPETAADFFKRANAFFNEHFNWLYILTVNVILIAVLYLGISKYGRIRLGGDSARPEFGTVTWYAMMFSAGIGIGVFFYGVAEPFYHMNIPAALQSGSDFDNFKVMYLNWGFHAWAVYSIFGIALGYFAYNKGLPFAARSIFYPVLKDKIYGIWGDIIDSACTVPVLFGLAASLGLGAKQINAGVSYVFGIPSSSLIQLFIIITISVIATMAVSSGLARGMKWLSQINMVVSGLLLCAILFLGPASYIISTYLSGLGIYLRDFLSDGLFTAVRPEDIAWQGQWTVFYWSWWFSFAPFVGIFIAQISRGRTVKQLALGGVIVPIIAITAVMTILGASGQYLDFTSGGAIKAAIDSDVATSIFEMFRQLSDSRAVQVILSVTAVTAISTFFLTSSDSGSLVVSSLASGGMQSPPGYQRIFWAVIQGGIAAAVLLLGGEKSFDTIQSAVIMLGMPFSAVLLFLVYSLFRGLKSDVKSAEALTVPASAAGPQKVPASAAESEPSPEDRADKKNIPASGDLPSETVC